MKLSHRTDPDRIFQYFMDTYGYLLGAAVMIAGFALIGFLIVQ